MATRTPRVDKMSPYEFIRLCTKNGESLLSLCCGIGLELKNLNTSNITAVDISPQYIAEVSKKYPHVKAIQSDVLEYISKQPDNSVDVISFIDGIEHMTKKTGLKVLEHIKRVTRKRVILFFPEGINETGYLRNEPHNAWDIEGSDEFQKHKSGWKDEEVKALGFTGVSKTLETSQHNEPYYALMFEYIKE
jgi:ubiquinone/menaquinone biosynthesis C-methylase UbiE